MNNFNRLKYEIYSIYNMNNMDIKDLNIENLVDIMYHDCSICFCLGCRNFEERVDEKEYISVSECKNYIKYYLSKEYDPFTDDCWCDSCIKYKKKRDINSILIYKEGEDGNIIFSNSVQKAKSIAINKGLYRSNDYIKLKYKIIK